MTKLCSVCGTENRDEVQFCRACGNAFSALAPTSGADHGTPAASAACIECGFQNKPGVRYCANCGINLVETSAGASPPPIAYPSFAPVAPYPPPPVPPAAGQGSDYPPVYDATATPPDIADPDAAVAVRASATYDTPPGEPGILPAGPPAQRTPLVIGVVALALAAAGAAAWWFLSGSERAQPVSAAASAPAFAASAALAPPPVPAAPASATIAVEPGSASSPFAPFTTEALVVPPSAAESAASDAEAKRVAAEKRREKAAKDKAEREAKAKALAEEQQAAAASARAEQDAQARRRAEEAQRSRPQAAPPVQPSVVAQPRGVREICAGRGTIGEAICQSRQCGAAEHANEAICRQIRDADERRRNYSN